MSSELQSKAQFHHTASNPLITLSIMIKNESSSIKENLLSYYNAGFRHFFVLDTGSTDNTVEIVEDFFQNPGIVSQLIQEPFIDFSASRNRAMELTEEYFPENPFILMPDAEWYLEAADELFKFCLAEQNNDTDAYFINIKLASDFKFQNLRLFRTHAKVRFLGKVHEAAIAERKGITPTAVSFLPKPNEDGKKRSQERWVRDEQILKQGYIENPSDSRNTFYLAQTYECLNNLESAYYYYQQRALLNGFDEEDFICFYRLGYIAEKMIFAEPSLAWAKAMDYYLKAFSLRPHRIEPLIKLADHYWPSNMQSTYLFIQYAYKIPYPSQDVLFIENKDYTYNRYEIMSRCAWHMGQYHLGLEATEKALLVHPEMEHLQRNLEIYKNSIQNTVA